MAKYWIILALPVLAGLICFNASASFAFLTPPNLPRDHPVVRDRAFRSNVFFALMLFLFALAILTTLRLRHLYRSRRRMVAE
jgi:hypothetical protein